MLSGIIILTTLLAGSTLADTIYEDLYFDILNSGRKEWKLAFRGTAGVGQSAFQAYKDGTGVPASSDPGCKQVGMPLNCHHHFRNNYVLGNWREIEEVALVLYKDNQPVKHIIFNGVGSNTMNWMSAGRVKSSSWSDLKTTKHNFFSIVGHNDLNRRFFINQGYGGCPSDRGWFVAIERLGKGCGWENNVAAKPAFKYAKGNSYVNWNLSSHLVGEADYFAVLVKYKNIGLIMGW